ncbi:MAG: M48 family metalloprotease [Thermoanaerobaculia bacterium]|nr:M48 family metalloprotease [Thermoanaerobaculia bacterium]
MISKADLERCWREALDFWEAGISLRSPVEYVGRPESKWKAEDPLAYIDLTTRQIVVNLALMERLGLESSLRAVLAHEIGHHIRFPHTLGISARLLLLERRLLPLPHPPVSNLFFDLLVNEVVGRADWQSLAAVYRGFRAAALTRLDPFFGFYLAVYDELWALDPPLVSEAERDRFEAAFPGFGAEARVFAQTFYGLSGLYLQFVYFCSIFARYVPERPHGVPFALMSDIPLPSPEDLADALEPSEEEEAALEDAVTRGWLAGAPGVTGDPLARAGAVLSGFPGAGQAEFRQTLAHIHYRKLIDRHLLELPSTPVRRAPDVLLPATLEAWEPGDSPKSIDWVSSVLLAGEMAAASPMKRELEEDPPPSEPGLDVPPVEIYLDTSGSMPNPIHGVNAMTLSAQILSASALRRRGRVRAVVYSYQNPAVSGWMYDESRARDFLFQFAGSGTRFPFEVLKKLSSEEKSALRVIISDADLVSNVQTHEGSERILLEAARRSRVLIILLAWWTKQDFTYPGKFAALRSEPRLRVLTAQASDLARVASGLARAILGG